MDIYFYILWRNHHFDKAIEVGNEMRANAIRANRPTTSADSQIAMVQGLKEKYAKKTAENKSK